MKPFRVLYRSAIIILAFVFSVDAFAQNATTKMNHSSNAVNELRTNMRKLWEDHITWTRNVICCLVYDLPGADQAVTIVKQFPEKFK